MSVTEIKQAIGSWTVQLKSNTPQQILDALTFFGHIALLPGEVNPAQYSDNLLSAARYVGVYRGRDAQDKYTLKGSGMAYWLGDEDGKGDIFETLVDIVSQTFPNTIRALLPPSGAITEGTLNSVPGTYTGKHQWQTPREAITYVTDLFDAEWRVNNNATLDAGAVSSLYVTTPKTLVLRRGFGSDLARKAISGDMSMGTDVEDITTRVVVLAEGEGTNIATGSANVISNPYKDLHGNTIKLTRLISESATSVGNAHSRAVVQLNRYITARRAVELSTSEYDVKGTFVVGDYLDVYDPENGFFDANREIYWQGDRLNPMKLRCVEMTWPIPSGWTVAFRDINGNWIDLTPYYVSEQGDTRIVVGELARGLASVGGEPIGVRPNLPDSPTGPDTTIPAAPAFTGFSTGSYESDDRTLAAIYAQWAQPLNGDGSTITDGDHYEIRYRPNRVMGTSTPWDYLSGGYAVDYEDDFNTPATNGFGAGWTSIGGSTNQSVAGGEARISHTTFNTLWGQVRTTPTYTNVEILSSNMIDYYPSGGSTVMGVVKRVDANNTYWVRVEPNVNLSLTLKITRYKAGVFSELKAMTVPGITHEPGVEVWSLVSMIGNVISAKVWQGTRDDEPERDTASVIDTDPIVGAGQVGFWDYIVSASTNPLGSITRHSYLRVRSLTPDNVANAYSWDDLGTWDALTSEPVVATPNWTTTYVGWDQTAFTLVELGPGVQYELQIRAVDTSANFSPWSTSAFVNTSGDAVSPSAPAPPEVSASLIAVQLVHRLGKASGGTFNLEPDLHHFDVHASDTPTFYPDDTTKVGELLASGSMVRGSIPAIGTFKVDQPDTVWIRVVAVDRTGNKSGPSEAVQSSVVLIDNAHISDLSVSKLTAGTITAQTVLAAEMEVGAGGNIKITDGSFDAYDAAGQKRVEVGLLPDGSYDLAAYDPATGAQVNLAQLAFGMKGDDQQSSMSITQSSVGGIPQWVVSPDGRGPIITNVRIGSSKKAAVFYSCTFAWGSSLDTNNRAAKMSFRVKDQTTGLVTRVASDAWSTAWDTDGIAGFFNRFGSFSLVPDYAFPTVNGLYTFEAMYMVAGFNSANMDFSDRSLLVIPF